MVRPRLPFRRLLLATLMRGLPGLAVMAILAVLGLIAPLWAILGGVGCIILAAFFAIPIARDLAALSAHADALARGPDAAQPQLSNWPPASELAAAMGRIARESERRHQLEYEGTMASQLVFDSLPQPLLVLDAACRVVSVNRQGRELIGFDPTGSDIATAIRDPRVQGAIKAALADKKNQTVNLTVSDPVDRFFSVEIVPFARPTENGAALLIALYDLTERQRTEQMRADFVANASHELRTPLASLIGFIETLRGPARDDAEAREQFLPLMHEQAQRMARLVEDLLSLSAIELDEHTVPNSLVDVVSMVARVTTTLQLEAQKKNIKIVTEADENLPPVTGDADQLVQLFQNLVDNAIKYGRDGGEVRVTIHHETEIPPALEKVSRERGAVGVLRICVVDQGEGIAAEHLPRLTERFYRVDAARSRAVGGTGLGLAIVKHIVNRHRGLLTIDSEKGVGSTFAVVLPEGMTTQTARGTAAAKG